MPIPLRPRSPMHPGYGQRMMPQRFYGGMPYNQFNYPPQMASPMMARNNGKRGGGLLAKILGRGNQQPGAPRFVGSMSQAAPSGGGGGLLKSLTNPDALNGLLNNTQTLLKAAQQFGPVIEQYGPLVRNIPSLWKLYRGLKDATSENDENKENEININEGSVEVESGDNQELVEINPILQDTIAIQSKKTSKPISKNGRDPEIQKFKQSSPKLYI